MKKIIMTSALLCASFILVQAQSNELYVPREIKKAYENGTRSYDGKPGAKYWQNTVDYTIEVEVTPENREISGSEKAVFNNNSPNDLNQLVIRLYHDVFRKGNQRGMQVNQDDINEGVEISKLMIGGKEIDLEKEANRRGTNLVVKLPESIAANSATTIEVDWKMVIPETTRRTGAYDSTSFFVSYWYPQIAVYDDLFGWDMLSYDFSTEFYNNLGNYDVKIKALKNFTVMATGVLQNPKEVFNADKLALYNEAKMADSTITIVSVDDAINGYSHQSGTWNYKASEVTDFSFCLSDHFVWDAANQKVEDRDVLVSTFYNVKVAEGAAMLTGIQQKTMKHFSEDVPGIAYPYPEFTTCVMGVGGGGMETPMMANNGQPGRGVTIHEMFHTYFPMYVRVNEKRFAWMDEGWANFNTSYVTQKYFQDDDSTMMIENSGGGISGTLGTLSDLPLITSTQFMDNSNYGYASYPLPAFMYSVLHHHLGDELFRKCYSEYIASWAKKSPTPYDFFNTFERVSGQDLDWFWNPWFFNYGDVDLAIASFDKGNLQLSKNGDRPIPVVVNVMYKDSTTWSSDHSAEIWKTQSDFEVEIPQYKKVATISVNKSLPDADDLDNYYPSISERYGDFKIAENLLGEYPIKEFPVTLVLQEKDNLVHLSVANIKAYMVPVKDNVFEDLSGNMTLELIKTESDTINLQLTIRSFGVKVTGTKK
jgi:hypothetical protein